MRPASSGSVIGVNGLPSVVIVPSSGVPGARSGVAGITPPYTRITPPFIITPRPNSTASALRKPVLKRIMAAYSVGSTKLAAPSTLADVDASVVKVALLATKSFVADVPNVP